MANHSKSQAKHPCTAVYLFVAVLFFVGYLLFSESPPAQSNTPRKGNGTAVGTDARTGATTLQPLIHDPTYDAEMTSVVEVAKLRAFEEWLHRNGAVNNLSIRRTASAGFTTMARVAFKKDELLFKVPHEIILTPFKLMKPMVDASAKEGSPFHFYKDWLAKEEPTALFIMHEMQPKRHGKSFWTPYFDMLPRDYESFHPLFWNDEQLEYLVPEISGFVSNLRTKVQNSYDALLRNLIKKRPDLIPEDEFTFKRFATAFLNVYTRAYARPDDIATDEKAPEFGSYMLPLDDMRNHEPFEMVSPVLTSGYVLRPNTNARSTPFRQHDNYLIAQRDIQKGQEIFSSYTMSSVEGNAYLLAKYGFIVPHDPHAAISWSTPLRHFFLNALTHHHGTEVVVMPRYRRPLYFMAWCRAFVASSHDFVSSSSATPSSVRKLVLTSFDFSRVASLGQEMKALSACSDVFPAETELKKQMEQIDYVQRAWGLKEERITAASSIQSKKFRFGWLQKRNILELQLMTKQYFNKRRAFLLEMCRLPTALEDNF